MKGLRVTTQGGENRREKSLEGFAYLVVYHFCQRTQR